MFARHVRLPQPANGLYRYAMKLLRILTGVHAGAELHLSAGLHRIGADDDADIRISDWSGADVLLTVDESGIVSAQRLLPEAQTDIADGESEAASIGGSPLSVPDEHESVATMDPGTVLLIDFVPMRFDDTVLCVGASGALWPSDLELLSTLLVKPDQARREAERSRQRKLVGAVLACTMLGAVVVVGCVLLTTVVSRAALPRNAGDLAQQVNLALKAAHMNELHARTQGNNVVIWGMVPTAEDDATVRKTLARFPSKALQRRYDIAQNDASDIEDALGMQDIHVTYAGNGAFNITGKAAAPADVDAALVRIRRDLSTNVKQLRVQVAQSGDAAPPPQSFSELMSSDDVQYAETPDGVKHIYAEPDAAIASASDAAAAAAPPSSAQAPASVGAASAPLDTAKSGATSVPQPSGDGSPPVRVATSAYLPLPK